MRIFYREAQEKIRNYNMASNFYSKHPSEDCEHAIQSWTPAGGLQHRGGATTILDEDEATWLSGGLCWR
jgi:hypothetical protein